MVVTWSPYQDVKCDLNPQKAREGPVRGTESVFFSFQMLAVAPPSALAHFLVQFGDCLLVTWAQAETVAPLKRAGVWTAALACQRGACGLRSSRLTNSSLPLKPYCRNFSAHKGLLMGAAHARVCTLRTSGCFLCATKAPRWALTYIYLHLLGCLESMLQSETAAPLPPEAHTFDLRRHSRCPNCYIFTPGLWNHFLKKRAHARVHVEPRVGALPGRKDGGR